MTQKLDVLKLHILDRSVRLCCTEKRAPCLETMPLRVFPGASLNLEFRGFLYSRERGLMSEFTIGSLAACSHVLPSEAWAGGGPT